MSQALWSKATSRASAIANSAVARLLRLVVTGWVRNRSDGTVEALICGPSDAVEALVAEMRKGPRFATVSRVSAIELDGTPGDNSGAFVIPPTA